MFTSKRTVYLPSVTQLVTKLNTGLSEQQQEDLFQI